MKNTISHSYLQMLLTMLFMLPQLACAATTNLKEGVIYQKELEFTINGTKAKGVFVAPKQASYKMVFTFSSEAAVVKLTTCHREETFRNVKSVNYEYKPQRNLEDSGSCLFEVASFNTSGQDSWGLIDFQTDDEQMYANQGCNGQSWLAKGVSLCQSKSGLTQTITFQKPVRVTYPERCPKMTTTDQQNFYYEIAQDRCVYLFSAGPKDLHRLTTFGYQDVLLK